MTIFTREAVLLKLGLLTVGDVVDWPARSRLPRRHNEPCCGPLRPSKIRPQSRKTIVAKPVLDVIESV